MTRLRVFMTSPPDPGARAILDPALDPSIDLRVGPDTPDPADYEVIVSGRPGRERLAASPNLHTLVIPWAGLPAETRALLADFPRLEVCNLHHNAAPTAELAVALLLAAAKRLVPIDRDFRGAHDWRSRYEDAPSVLLEGKTALVLGWGAVGRRVGRVCRAFGMDVIGVRRRAGADEVDADDGAIAVHPLAALGELLPRAEVLVLALPHTDATEGLLGEAELALLPERAVLVNVGRAPVVDEAALHAALASGRLHGAGLDVWWRYPKSEEERVGAPPAEHPFWELDGCVLSPHRAAACPEREGERMRHLAAVLNALGRGEPVATRVDPAQGY